MAGKLLSVMMSLSPSEKKFDININLKAVLGIETMAAFKYPLEGYSKTNDKSDHLKG